MQKFTFSVVLAVLLSFNLSAQNTDFCGTDDHYHKLLKENPELIQAEKDYEKLIQEKIQELRSKDGEDEEVLIVPVVFHVLHDYGPENINDAQIFDAINQMNKDNKLENEDASQIIPEFEDIASATNIQFRLANVAPDGSCTNGINRIETYWTNFGSDRTAKFVQWPTQSYLNIWVVRNMNSGTAGFSFYPSSVNTPSSRGLDGIVVRHNYVGAIGTSNPGRSHTLSHEAGHYLNLAHVWGNTNDPGQSCGDDGVADTPVTKGYNFCPTASSADNCNEGIIENFQNFMEYSGCTNMFTQGQVDRMRAALMTDIAFRDYLVSEQNNINTGTAEDEPSLCKPTVNFYTDEDLRWGCTDDGIQFHAEITNGQADTYSWSFPGAEVESFDIEDPIVTYTTQGWKTVTLTAGNASGSATLTKEYPIYIFDDSSIEFNHFKEGFETEAHTYGRFIVNNTNNNEFVSGINWGWSPVGCLDEGSMKLNLFDNPTPERYQFITPKFNLEGKAGEFVSFKYAFATQGTPEEIGASLDVKMTTNCGGATPVMLSIDDAADVVTAGNYSDVSFAPNNEELWKTGVFEISSALAQDGVQLIFEVTSDFGENNFYIDNLNIGSWLVSTEDEEVVNALKLYPNPASDEAQLDFTLNRPSEMNISIFDLTGKKVKAINTANYPTGIHTVKINTSDLPAGAYIVQLQGTEFNESLKLLLNK